MSNPTKTWQTLERDVAKFFNTKTNRAFGQGVNIEDVLATPNNCPWLKDRLIVECKYRKGAGKKIRPKLIEPDKNHFKSIVIYPSEDNGKLISVLLKNLESFYTEIFSVPRIQTQCVLNMWHIYQLRTKCPGYIEGWLEEANIYANKKDREYKEAGLHSVNGERNIPVVCFKEKRTKDIICVLKLKDVEVY